MEFSPTFRGGSKLLVNCCICPTKLVSKSSLGQHMDLHRKDGHVQQSQINKNMSRRVSLVSCPICGRPLWCLKMSIFQHAARKHKLSLEEYLEKCGGVDWFLAQREANCTTLNTRDLTCTMRGCRKSVEGVWAMSEHLRTVHRKTFGNGVDKMLRRLAKQLGLKKCGECSMYCATAFLTDADFARHMRHEHDEISVEGCEEEFRRLVFPDEGDNKEDCKKSIKHESSFSNYCNCEGDLNQLDGCEYFCPKKCQGEFKSLAQITEHITKCHGGDLQCFRKLKELRRVVYIKCQHCGKNVIHDRMEMGHHLWNTHGISIEAYQLFQNPAT